MIESEADRIESALPLISSDGNAVKPNTGIVSRCWWITRQLLALFNVFSHGIIFYLISVILRYSTVNYSPLYLHVTFCSIGYIFFITESLLVLADGNLWSSFFARRIKKRAHLLLQYTGYSCILTGTAIMYFAESRSSRSVHVITGIVSVMVMCAIIFCHFILACTQLKGTIRPTVAKFCHTYLGIVCFVLGMISQCYGYKKMWIPYSNVFIASLDFLNPACIIFTVLVAVFSLVSPLRSLYRSAADAFK